MWFSTNRKREARSVLGDRADTPGGPDPGSMIENQFELAAAIRSLVDLTDRDQLAILERLADKRLSKPVARREKMRRYRARRRLAAMVVDWDEHGYRSRPGNRGYPVGDLRGSYRSR